MSERRWDFVVQDARSRRRRGTVAWCDALASPLRAPSPPHEFAIVMLVSKCRIAGAPERTAVCCPGTPKIRPVAGQPPQHLPEAIEALTLPPYRMAAYAAGRIVTAVDGLIEPVDVFPPHSDHPRLDRLALALLDAFDAEERAPYLALVRREFALPPGGDPLQALGARLVPDDAQSRPPARAPGVLRLAKALRLLRVGLVPESTLEQFAEDLRFLKLFDASDKAWTREALGRLLDDVMTAPARLKPRRRGAAKPPPNVVRLRPDRDRTSTEGDE